MISNMGSGQFIDLLLEIEFICLESIKLILLDAKG